MDGIKLNLRLKSMFFDRAAVMNAHGAKGKSTIAALGRFGAFVRQRAKSSLRRRKKISSPGSPPSVHSTNPDASLKKILFAYDPASRSVVIGPVLLNGNPYSGTTVPAVLEEGGTVVRRTRQGPRTLHYAARPFMGPALAAELPNMPKAWQSNATLKAG